MKPTIGRIVHVTSELRGEVVWPAMIVGVREAEGFVEPLLDLVVFSAGHPTASLDLLVMAKDEPDRAPGQRYWIWPPRD